MLRPLNAFSVADTHQIDEMRGVLFDVYDVRHFDMHGDKKRFSAKAAFLDLGSSSLSHCCYESPVRIDFRDDDYIRFQICTAGNGRTSAGSQAAEFGRTQIVCSPAGAVLEFGQSLEQFALRIDRTKLEQDLATILGTRPKERITFDLAADCSIGQTRRFREKVMYTAHSVDITDDPIPQPLLRDMDQSIRISALYGMPHNFTERLYSGGQKAAPWQVTRVEEWIDANWRSNVTIEKLAEVSGSSIRSIFATFKNTRGYTPMEYLKRVRLHTARGMLLVAQPGASVTAIGFACHFSNMGHFARDYQEQFGELPSATLHKSRRLAA